jgi:chromosomal replication initiator protein
LNLTIVWEDFLKIIREEVGSRIVETWFKAVTLSHWDASKKTMYLQVPNAFIKQWVSTHYTKLFQYHLGRLLHQEIVHILFIDAFTQPLKKDSIAVVTTPEIKSEKESSSTTAIATKPIQKNKAPLNNDYLFKNFILGPSNQLAHAAAEAVAASPGILYNPLFIYGNSGLGKTHLLHAIGNHIKATRKKMIVLYQTADRFVNEFINAIRFDKIGHFEARYKTVDVLLIDDIQFISNKEQTQEAFFHIFNALYDAQKQIIFTSDSFPRDIQGLAERLRSRLEGGMITDIQTPTLETKIAILKKKAELHNEQLSDEVACFIASCALNNIRELEGALIRVLAFASLTQQTLSIEVAQKVLSKVKETRTAPIGLKKIAHCVAFYYSLHLQDLRSAKRDKDLSLVRHIAMYLMKKMTSSSLAEIAAFWRRKNHSTVIHAIEKIEKTALIDQSFFLKIADLEEKIKSES